jgi:putative transcriptional regulator
MKTQPQRAAQLRRSPLLKVPGPLIAALAVLLALLTAGDRSLAGAPAPMNAILLLAQPLVQDDVFNDSAVLVMNNLGPDPVGLIVNKPTRLPVSMLFPEMKGLANLPDKIYFGGPVELESVWFLIRASSPPQNASQTCPGLYVSTSRTLLLSLLARRHPMENLRIFFGHSGWAPGQLQDEISAGAWKLQQPKAETIFDTPEHTWPSSESGPKSST